MYSETKWKQFLNLKQRNLSVAEYEKEFSHLSKYAPESVLTEAFRCRQFEDGLNGALLEDFLVYPYYVHFYLSFIPLPSLHSFSPFFWLCT